MLNICELFEEELKKNNRAVIEEYEYLYMKRESERLKYRNSIKLKYLLKPYFYSREQVQEYERFCKTLVNISIKVIDEYVNNKKMQELYGFDQLTNELITLKLPYDVYLPRIRADIFFTNGDFKLCEINTDGSAGMMKDATINNELLLSTPLKKISQYYKLGYRNLISIWVEKSIELYNQYRIKNQNAPKTPVVAVLNFRDTNNFQETIMFCNEYKNHGIDAYPVDPRELVYHNEHLYFNGIKIDLVYKEIITSKLLKSKDENQQLINAIKDNKVCIIGNTKCLIIDDKSYFAILHSSLINNSITPEEKDFINKYIPYTKFLKEGHMGYSEALTNKDKYIIKSKDTYGGLGVYPGKNYSYDGWKELLDSCWNKDYIIQEFIETEMSSQPYILNGNIEYDNFRITTGLFCYNHEFAGMYSRASKDVIINDYGINDYYVGNIYYEEKE